jgi:hypothetical protein
VPAAQHQGIQQSFQASLEGIAQGLLRGGDEQKQSALFLIQLLRFLLSSFVSIHVAPTLGAQQAWVESIYSCIRMGGLIGTQYTCVYVYMHTCYIDTCNIRLYRDSFIPSFVNTYMHSYVCTTFIHHL